MYMIGYLNSKLLVYKRFLGDSGLDGWFGEVYECFFLSMLYGKIHMFGRQNAGHTTVDLFC